MEGIYFEFTSLTWFWKIWKKIKTLWGPPVSPNVRTMVPDRATLSPSLNRDSHLRTPFPPPFSAPSFCQRPPPHAAIRATPPSRFFPSCLLAPISSPLRTLFCSSASHTLPPLHPNDRPSKPLKSRPGVPSLCRQADAQFGRPVNSSGIPMSFLPSTSSTASASPWIPSSSHRPSQPAPPLAPHR
jgi:hypothetical protein